MLKEARIVMPFANFGSDHSQLRAALVETFGGYTCAVGQGGWYDEVNQERIDDSVVIYDVAIDDTLEARRQLLDIALDTGRALDQQAVYVRYPDGRVDIVDTKPGQIGEGPTETTASDTDMLYEEITGKPFLKRLPQPGEVWEARCGALVAVLSNASVLDGGLNTVSLTKGDSAVNAGRVMLHALDGLMYGGSKGEPRPYDLKLFVKRWERD